MTWLPHGILARKGTQLISGTNAVQPVIFSAAFGPQTGTARMFLDGTNGSSSWAGALGAFAGASNNATNTNSLYGTTMSTSTTSPASLALINPLSSIGPSTEGNTVTFLFSMAGFTDFRLSYDTRNSATTAFSTQTWAYSTDGGGSWSGLNSFSPVTTTFQTVSFAPTSVLDGVSDARLRLTVSGSTALGGNNRLDNIVFAGTAIPEPGSSILLVSTLGFLLVRRKKCNGPATF